MDWRDLKIVLAVGRHGSLRAASRAVSADPTTVSRRVSAVETALNTPLFVRQPRSWTPTEAGRLVLERCEAMAVEARALRMGVDRYAEQVSGRVRLTGVDEIFGWLTPHLPLLRERHPSLQIELRVTNTNVDLRKGQADVAVRMGRPDVAGLKVRRLTDIDLVVACHDDLWRCSPQRRPIVWIGTFDTDNPENRLLRDLPGTPVVAATSLSVCMSLVRSGVGIGVVPASFARAHGLQVVKSDLPPRSLWRAVPEEWADAPRIRAVTDWLDAIFDEPLAGQMA